MTAGFAIVRRFIMAFVGGSCIWIETVVCDIKRFSTHDGPGIRTTVPMSKKNLKEYRDLIVRVAGYGDYLCDLNQALQDEIIAGMDQEGF